MDDGEDRIRRGLFPHAVLRPGGGGEQTREILRRERLHGVVRLVRYQRADHALRLQLLQQREDPVIRHGQVGAVPGVVGVEGFVDGVHLRLARPGRDGAFDELPDAVADEGADLRHRPRGEALRAERVVDALPQVGQRVEERAVEIKDRKLIHGTFSLSAFLPAIIKLRPVLVNAIILPKKTDKRKKKLWICAGSPTLTRRSWTCMPA